MKLFGKCFRENFASPLTYAAAVLFAVLCGAGATVQIGEETYSFFEIAFNSKLLSQTKYLSECSSYLMAYRFSQSAWYAIGLAVLTAIPVLYTYVRSLEKIHCFALIRSNYRAYSAGIVFSSFLSGMIITLAGILTYTAAAYLLFPSFESFSSPDLNMIYGETVSVRLFSLIKKAFNHALVGGVISVFAITLYRFIRSDFLAATLPMMLMYISVKVLPNYREWLSSDIRRSENAFARVLAMLFPSNLTDLGNSLETSFNAPFWLAYIVLGAFLFATYLLFYKSIRKV